MKAEYMPNSSPSLFVFLIAVPVFIITIALEWWYASQDKDRALYDLADSTTNLQLGSGQLLVGLLSKGPLLALYAFLHEWALSWGVPNWDQSNWGLWILGFLIMDCAYYWFHRFSHEYNFLWAAHAVHHQSEYYNLSVALRQSWFQQIYSGLFYLPLAFLGIPMSMFFLLNALNTLSQYWIHTQVITQLGPLESFLNTPSHHRVHHGTDDEYVDKNYAGALIIWDRMFGTFAKETNAPRYGVIKALRTWNSGWANFDVWAWMWKRMRSGDLTVGETLSLPFRAPAWSAEQEKPVQAQFRTHPDYELYQQRGPWFIYAVGMSVLDILLGAVLIALAPKLSTVYISLGALILLSSSVIHGAMLDGRVWATKAEMIKYGLAAILVVFLLL